MPNEFFERPIDGKTWNYPGGRGDIRQGRVRFGLKFNGNIEYDEYETTQLEDRKPKPIKIWKTRAAEERKVEEPLARDAASA